MTETELRNHHILKKLRQVYLRADDVTNSNLEVLSGKVHWPQDEYVSVIEGVCVINHY